MSSNKKNRQPTISQELTKSLIITVTLIFLVTSIISLWLYSLDSEETYLEKHAEYLAYLTENLKLPLWNVDQESINNICSSFTKNEIISLLRVTTEENEPLYTMVNEDEPSLIVAKKDVHHNDILVGSVELGFTRTLYEQSNYQMFMRSMLPMLFVIIGLIVATKLLLNKLVNKPLEHLISRIEEISAGNYKEKTSQSSHFEITTILDSFNEMATRVKKRELSLLDTNKQLASEIHDRMEAEKARLESERRYKQLVEELPIGVFRTSTQHGGRFLMANPALVKMLGYDSEEELLKLSVQKTYKDPNMRAIVLEMVVREHTIQGLAIELKRKDGQPIECLITTQVIHDDEDNPIYMDGIIEDISARASLERQIRQTQKMEAIGTLAGGIAHDFNNILSSIFGFTEAAKLRYKQGKTVAQHFDEILNAGLRARSLIKQMLAFSQQTEVKKAAISIGPVIKETTKFLRASLPAMVEIKREFKVSNAIVWADPTHIHQIIMNLCTNAAHAMREEGGALEIELDERDIDVECESIYRDLPPGPYVQLTVTDTGHGISKENIDRIFEPFFTTKKRGEGTGMGLAVIHGLVSDMDGKIIVESEMEKGSCFRVLLPRDVGKTDEKDVSTSLPEKGSGKILFVDDEEGFVVSGKEIFEHLGFDLVPATSGEEAYTLFKEQPEAFDIVVTDLAMPKITGFELAKKIKAIREDIPIVLCTGFSAGINKNSEKYAEFSDIIMKPILAKELVDAVLKALEAN